MWAVDNQTRFKAERCFVRDRDGAEVWLVAVRATFTFTPDGRVAVADEQQDVSLAPTFFGEPGRSSPRYDTDLPRTKGGTDVLLHASAHAPGGKPAEAVEVGWRVGPLSKSLRVVGDRVWEGGVLRPAPGRPKPFAVLPIRYERALGGPLAAGPDAPRDPANPLGVGRVAAAGAPVPNCEFPGRPVRSPRDAGPPAGFGPIGYDWEPRVRLAGTYDDAWKETRRPLLPADFRDEFYRPAPPDQQADRFLQGGEAVELRNLTPEGLVRFELPRVTLGFSTRVGGDWVRHRGDLHTVILEPDDRRLVMVWHTALPCHHTLYTLKETVVIEKERLPLGAG